MESNLPHAVLVKIREPGKEDSILFRHGLHLLKLFLRKFKNVHITATLQEIFHRGLPFHSLPG